MKSILCTLLILIGLLNAVPKLSEQEATQEINKMILATTANIHYKIKEISAPTGNISIVTIDSPYREFPNIILFSYRNNSWQRIFEGLSIGIQDNQSDTPDLHTLGEGIDFTINNQAKYSFDPETKKTIETSAKSGLVVIPYRNFLHAHRTGITSYTIDKTMFFELANNLHNNKYTKYPQDKCIMYDQPKLKSTKFAYKNGRYLISSRTQNGQVWEISFTGIEDNKYIQNKIIKLL